MNKVTLKRGSLRIPAPLYAEYLSGVQGVALLREQNDLLIIPVFHAGVGGYLLKQSSPEGERVIHAGPFLYEQGIGDEEITAEIAWEGELGQLTIRGLFGAVHSVMDH